MLYHRDDQLIWDLNGSDDGWEQCKLEVMAEDLRLLYVALTRPVYRCYLYIANHCRMNKSGINSYLANTAIGYLLGIQDNKCDADTMTASAQTLACEAISVSQIIPTTQVTQLKGLVSNSNSLLSGSASQAATSALASWQLFWVG